MLIFVVGFVYIHSSPLSLYLGRRGGGEGESGHIGIADGVDCCSSFYLVEFPHSVSFNFERLHFNEYLSVNYSTITWKSHVIWVFDFILQFLMEPSASLNKKMANHTIYIYIGMAMWLSCAVIEILVSQVKVIFSPSFSTPLRKELLTLYLLLVKL